VTVRWRLLLSSALMLFVELTLIRWLGANIVHLSYFSNFVLLGSFLGIGLGFLRAGGPGHRQPGRQRPDLLHQPGHQRAAHLADPAGGLPGDGSGPRGPG